VSNLATVAGEWLASKAAEAAAVTHRRECEDKMLSLIGIPEDLDGVETADAPGGYKIKVVGRINRRVDGDSGARNRSGEWTCRTSANPVQVEA